MATPFLGSVAPIDASDYAAAQDFLRQHLSPALTGSNWDAMIAAIGYGDATNKTNARLAYDQIFRSTASGVYLDRRMGEYDVFRPDALGLSDDLFRKLGTIVTNSALTNLTLWQSLEVYYGAAAVRATLTSTLAEPYAIATGDTLQILVNEKLPVTVTFNAADFGDPANCKALEVCAVINRTFQLADSEAYALPFLNSVDGKNYVQLFSGALGPQGALRVQGGKTQNALRFPTLLPIAQGTTQWGAVFTASTNTVRLTFSASTDPLLDNIRPGDYVNIYGSIFHAQNRGTFVVTKVFVDASVSPRTTWFEYVNPTGFTENVTDSPSSNAIVFYRPTKSAQPTVKLLTADAQDLWVVLPATTQAVTRGPGTGAYLHVAPSVAVSSFSRNGAGLVTVNTAAPHGLVSNGFAFIDGMYPTPGSNNCGGRLNGCFQTTVTSSTQFTYNTPDALYVTAGTTGTITPVAAPKADSTPGPYLMDRNGLSITNVSSALTVAVSRNQSPNTLTVTSALSFPNTPGWLVLGFGTSNQQVVKYSGRISPTTILLDGTYTATKDSAIATDVTLLLSKGSWIAPDNAGLFWLTASAAGWVAALDTLMSLTGAGFDVEPVIITYPGDRGLGGEGAATTGAQKLSSAVAVWAGDDVDAEVAKAQAASDNEVGEVAAARTSI